MIERTLPPGASRGPMQGVEIIGEITEAIQKHIKDNWSFERAPPRIEEDLSFVPKDREEVVYIYMYRAALNRTLMNSKRYTQAPIERPIEEGRVYYQRAPLFLDLHYAIAVHSKFRSDAERLLGYVLLCLHEATHLVYRPMRYILPGGEVVNSKGEPWSLDVDMSDESIYFEKVSVALVDDLTIGDAINFFTIHEAPYRPYLTYVARCAMQGALIDSEATTVRPASLENASAPNPSGARRSGRLPNLPKAEKPVRKTPFGPQGHNIRRIGDDPGNPDSEDQS